ncbi:MAG TPA: hypothetical protein DCE73_11380 [Paraprevotella xylaniphila]|jgi:hypothetical protein|nr:hypothetical protein [Paraprevotella xylaniphila]
MMPGRKATLAASGEGECKFGACPACRFDIILLATGNVPNREKTGFKSLSGLRFQEGFRPISGGRLQNLRRKKLFSQPNDFSFA